MAALRTAERRPVADRLDDRVARRGDRHPDQPVAAAGDVVGVAGQVLGRAGRGCRHAHPSATVVRRSGAAVSATQTNDSSIGSATPLAKASPSRCTSTVPSARRQQQPAGPGVLDEVGLPLLDRVDGAGVGEPDVAVGGDRGVVAEHHPVRRRPRSTSRSTTPVRGAHREQAGVGVGDQQPVVDVELDAERATAGVADPVGPAPSLATRQMLPSSVPVQANPSVVDDDVLGTHGGHLDPARARLPHGWIPSLSRR